MLTELNNGNNTIYSCCPKNSFIFLYVINYSESNERAHSGRLCPVDEIIFLQIVHFFVESHVTKSIFPTFAPGASSIWQFSSQDYFFWLKKTIEFLCAKTGDCTDVRASNATRDLWMLTRITWAPTKNERNFISVSWNFSGSPLFFSCSGRLFTGKKITKTKSESGSQIV